MQRPLRIVVALDVLVGDVSPVVRLDVVRSLGGAARGRFRIREHGVDPTCQISGVLAAHEQKHQATGDALAALRELANDHDTAGALYRTRRALLEVLARLELDLHQHIHEENTVLFPRVRDLR